MCQMYAPDKGDAPPDKKIVVKRKPKKKGRRYAH